MSLIQGLLALCSLSAALVLPALAQDTTHAGQAVENGVAASGHTSASAAHSIAASGQLTSGALAVPFLASGAVMGSAGAGSAAVGRDALRAATAPIGTPLPITDETITVISPAEALKAKSPSL
jgi:hypothetical protein